jgi:5'-3' exonuclease
MDGVYAGIDTITAKKQREKLIANKAQALLSRELVAIDRHAPVQFDADRLKSRDPDEDALSRLFADQYASQFGFWRDYITRVGVQARGQDTGSTSRLPISESSAMVPI